MVALTMTTTTIPSNRPSFKSSSSIYNLSAAEIKERAKANVQSNIKSASTAGLLKVAREILSQADAHEKREEWKHSLLCYYMATSLVAALYGSQEYSDEFVEKRKKTSFHSEFRQLAADASEAASTIKKLEEKLEILEQSRGNREANGTVESAESLNRKVGGTIMSRINALQDSGLDVSTTKRFSRDFSVTSPTSPSFRPRPAAVASSSLISPSQSQSLPLANSPSIPLSAISSPHTFVSTSSFGPPSPTSSVASSPPPSDLASLVTQVTASLSPPSSPPPPGRFSSNVGRTESEFATAFPSVDEFDQRYNLPSVPRDEPVNLSNLSQQAPKLSRGPLPKPPTSSRGQITTGATTHNVVESSSFVTGGSPPPAPSGPALSRADRGPLQQRPASTPIPPINNTIGHTGSSDGESPVKVHRELPQVPPGNAADSHYVTRTPAKYMNGTHTHVVPSSNYDLPITSAYKPSDLKHYLQVYPTIKVLYFDTRTRAEFDMEHFPTTEVVCLEPNILMRDNLSSAAIEDALVVSPSSERALFSNRRKFDLIVLYDQCSASTTPAMTNLTEAIFTNEYAKSLKRPPVLLVGGLDAWKREGGATNSPPSDTAKRIESENKRQQTISPRVPNVIPSTPTSSFSSSSTNHLHDPHERWIPNRPRSSSENPVDRQPNYSTQTPIVRYTSTSPPPEELGGRLTRRPVISRPQSSSHVPSMHSRTPFDLYNSQLPSGYQYTPNPGSIQYPPITSGHNPYPTFSATPSASTGSMPTFQSLSNDNGFVSPPPVASINPSPLSRRRNEYVDQAHQVYSGVTQPSINYPDLSAQHVLRPPPAAASSALERQDQRPRSIQHVPGFSISSAGLINSEYPVPFWADVDLVKTGLKNLGNTCYMNSTIQCLSATVPFTRFFTDGRWKNAVNMLNPFGSKGNMASAFASLLYQLWHGDVNYLAPYDFRKKICLLAPQFAGTEQHDSQEFLSVLLDSLHEDLNRVLKRPNVELTPDREARLERLPQQIASAEEWKIYRMRNDSIIVDYFQGQFRNRMQCLTCEKTSTTYNTFMYLSLPIPNGRGKPSLYQCLDMLVKEEILEKSEAWNCPNCKILRRATKQLSLCRLPPVLLIHLKRFSNKGVFTDKVDTIVDFPIKNFDLTNYMPPPLSPAMDPSRGQSRDDPRTQLPPYRYDLYAVTNHTGSLTGGHYTAFVASRGGWLFCEDSSVKSAEGRNIVSQQAYILFYKRVRT